MDDPSVLPTAASVAQKVAADVQARYRRLQGKDVRFVLGNHDLSSEVMRQYKCPERYLPRVRGIFINLWKSLGISHDHFASNLYVRQHNEFLTDFFNEFCSSKALYLQENKRLYCKQCHEYKKLSDLAPWNSCKLHPKETLEVSYSTGLYCDVESILNKITLILADNFVDPHRYRKDLGDILYDMCRYKGIPVGSSASYGFPIYRIQTSNMSYTSTRNPIRINEHVSSMLSCWTFKGEHWPPDMMFINSYSLENYAVHLPILLEAAEFIFPKKIIVCSNITTERPQSNIKAPFHLIRKYIERFGSETVRLALMQHWNTKEGSTLNEKLLVETYNQLSNLQRLVCRIHDICIRYSNGVLPEFSPDKRQCWLKASTFKLYTDGMDSCDYHVAVDMAMHLVEDIDYYISISKLWDKERRDILPKLKTIIGGIRLVSTLLRPFVPMFSEEIDRVFNYPVPLTWKWTENMCCADNLFGLTKHITLDKLSPRWAEGAENPQDSLKPDVQDKESDPNSYDLEEETGHHFSPAKPHPLIS